MSVKKQIPSLCKLYSFFEETPEEFSDETDVDSYFYHNIFDISQSKHRIVQVSRGSNKKSVAIKFFQFCDLKTQQRYILQEEIIISKTELISLVDSLRDFCKTFDDASKCKQIPLTKPKIEIGSKKSKDNVFAQYYNDIIEHPTRQIRIRISFQFGNHNSCVFSIKKFELHGNKFILTDFVILLFTNSTRTDITLQTSVNQLRAITMCSAFTPDCGFDNSTFCSLGTCIFNIQSVLVNFAYTKRLLNNSVEAIITVRKCVCVPGAQYFF